MRKCTRTAETLSNDYYYYKKNNNNVMENLQISFQLLKWQDMLLFQLFYFICRFKLLVDIAKMSFWVIVRLFLTIIKM